MLLCSISKHRMLLFIKIQRNTFVPMSNFKTSYVTVYLSLGVTVSVQSRFQNIVCYCLSTIKMRRLLLRTPFQNIVCYCLSTIRANTWHLHRISKHRMLLFIRIGLRRWSNIYTISKHRMLLFIGD